MTWNTKQRIRHALWEAISGLSVYYLAYYVVSWVDFPTFLQGVFTTNPFSPLRVDVLVMDVLTTLISVGCADAIQMRLYEKASNTDSKKNFRNKAVIVGILGANAIRPGARGSKSLDYNTVQQWKTSMFFLAPLYWVVLLAIRHFVNPSPIVWWSIVVALPVATVILVYALIYRHLSKQNFAYPLQSSTLRVVDPRNKEK